MIRYEIPENLVLLVLASVTVGLHHMGVSGKDRNLISMWMSDVKDAYSRNDEIRNSACGKQEVMFDG